MTTATVAARDTESWTRRLRDVSFWAEWAALVGLVLLVIVFQIANPTFLSTGNISSMLVADGEPGRVLGLIDEESDLWEAIEKSETFAVTPLTPQDRQLADRFAGLMPAPGGLFAGGDWQQSDHGPVQHRLWAGCRLAEARPCGWALLVEGVIETITTVDPQPPLIHYRGRYRELDR